MERHTPRDGIGDGRRIRVHLGIGSGTADLQPLPDRGLEAAGSGRVRAGLVRASVALEHADLVVDLVDVAADLDTPVAAGRERVRDQAALDEVGLGRRGQPLRAHRNLHAAAGDVECLADLQVCGEVLEVLGRVVRVVVELDREPLPLGIEAQAQTPQDGFFAQRGQLAAGVLVVVAEVAEVFLNIPGEGELEVGRRLRELEAGADLPSLSGGRVLGRDRRRRHQAHQGERSPQVIRVKAHGRRV
jgi:hypothetical protein